MLSGMHGQELSRDSDTTAMLDMEARQYSKFILDLKLSAWCNSTVEGFV